MTLNETARRLTLDLAGDAATYRATVRTVAGAAIIDCGVEARGGLSAGLLLARISAAGLLDVNLVPDPDFAVAVQVATDHPLRACLGAQYAGHRLSHGDYFGMASGPLRALLGVEKVVADYHMKEESAAAVGVIESKAIPPAEVVEALAAQLGVRAEAVTLAVAPCASLAGGVQVVARSVETAMHKLYALGFDLNKVVSGFGTAPLPPTARHELAAVGRTNDAILYAGRVTLVVDCDDAEVDAIGPRVPSTSSRDHGRPFAELLTRAGGDFYKIDPMLFSPALVTFQNLRTGRAATFGKLAPEVVRQSFAGPA